MSYTHNFANKFLQMQRYIICSATEARVTLIPCWGTDALDLINTHSERFGTKFTDVDRIFTWCLLVRTAKKTQQIRCAKMTGFPWSFWILKCGAAKYIAGSRRFIFGLLSGSKPIFSGSRPGLGPHDVQEVFFKRPKFFAALMFVCRCRTRNISKKMNHKHYRLINVCVITKINNFAEKTRHK